MLSENVVLFCMHAFHSMALVVAGIFCCEIAMRILMPISVSIVIRCVYFRCVFDGVYSFSCLLYRYP